MRLKVYPEFTNFIAREYLEEVDINELIEYATDLRKKDPVGKEISNYGGWHSRNLNHGDGPIGKLFQIINSRADELHRHLGFTPRKTQKIGNAWININGKHDHNLVHTHPDSFFSGCFYVKVPADAGKIVFVNPNEAINWAINPNDIEERNSYNTKLMSIDPHDGLLLFFPPWLPHYVTASKSDDERISIAFNTDIVLK